MARFLDRWNVSPAGARIVAIGLITLVGVMRMPAPASADDEPAAHPQRWPWPCQLIVIGELHAVAELAWEHSPTFRDQCRKLAAAGATMVVEPVGSRQTWRAKTRIGRTDAGFPYARAQVRPAENALELIAHELEHVLEYVDGVKFLMEARAGRSGVSLNGGAYETRRAIDAGRRVAKEIRDHGAQKRLLAQNSTRRPNCH